MLVACAVIGLWLFVIVWMCRLVKGGSDQDKYIHEELCGGNNERTEIAVQSKREGGG